MELLGLPELVVSVRVGTLASVLTVAPILIVRALCSFEISVLLEWLLCKVLRRRLESCKVWRSAKGLAVSVASAGGAESSAAGVVVASESVKSRVHRVRALVVVASVVELRIGRRLVLADYSRGFPHCINYLVLWYR